MSPGHSVSRGARGFTMVELMIVVTVIVIIATMAVPSYLSSKVVANESAVIGTLRQIAQGQVVFRSAKHVVRSSSGGEFGFLGEITGTAALRGGGGHIRPPVLTASFGKIDANGIGTRNGYLFRLHLPDAGGVGVPETASTVGNVDPMMATLFFTVIAWPRAYGASGNRTFFVNQVGDIVTTIDTSYSGPGGAPVANAALIGVGAGVISSNSLATSGSVGVDGNRWRGVN